MQSNDDNKEKKKLWNKCCCSFNNKHQSINTYIQPYIGYSFGTVIRLWFKCKNEINIFSYLFVLFQSLNTLASHEPTWYMYRHFFAFYKDTQTKTIPLFFHILKCKLFPATSQLPQSSVFFFLFLHILYFSMVQWTGQP